MYLLRKRLFAGIFLAALFGFSLCNGVLSFPDLCRAEKSPAALENAVNESLVGRMGFVEFYAWQARILGKREINNFAYIQDEDGFLHYSSFFREPDTALFDYALRLKRLQDFVRARGTRVLFVVTPGKYIPGFTHLRPGLSATDPSDAVEQLLIYLNRLGVETLNLGQSLPGDGLPYEETFYRTDHHWTVPAAFAASALLIDKLNTAFDAGLDPEGFYRNPDNYETRVYPGRMLGSMGRRTGANFTGLEDFTAIWPKFENQYLREYLEESGETTSLQGGVTETLLVPQTLTRESSVYRDSLYSLYLNNLRSFEHIENLDAPEEPSVLFIRDSYFSPVMVFLAPLFSRMDAIWSLETVESLDIEQYIREHTFDYIIVETYPYNISDAAFSFFREG